MVRRTDWLRAGDDKDVGPEDGGAEGLEAQGLVDRRDAEVGERGRPGAEEDGSDVWHLLRTDRWADGDPAVDMDDDEWYDLVATACRIEAVRPSRHAG